LDIGHPGLLITYILIFVFAFFYKKKQDQNQMGGKIAYSKSLWLFYCIFTWFVIPLALLTNGIETKFHLLLLCFGLSFWIRGLFEMIMLYITKSWKPIYGISHNIFTFILVFALSVYFREELFFWEIHFVIFTMLALSFETYYAFFFKKYIGEKTKGDQAIWFANAEDPLFKTNLKITLIGNFILFPNVLLFLLNYY
jgi:hypothetical protein